MKSGSSSEEEARQQQRGRRGRAATRKNGTGSRSGEEPQRGRAAATS